MNDVQFSVKANREFLRLLFLLIPVLVAVAGLVLSFWEMMWAGVILLVIVTIPVLRYAIRYDFGANGIEKRLYMADFTSSHAMPPWVASDVSRSIHNPASREHQTDDLEVYNRGLKLRQYRKSGMKKVTYTEGRFFAAFLLEYEGCQPFTSPFIWMHHLKNNGKLVVIRVEKNRAANGMSLERICHYINQGPVL